MVSWRISESVKVHGLPNDTARLLYTWLLTHCDNLGRFHGEPVQVLAIVFPKRRDVTVKAVTEYLRSMYVSGLIDWYEVNGLRYLQIPPPVWEREQRLHHNMSRISDFPPLTEEVRIPLRTPSVSLTSVVRHEVEVEGEVETKTRSESSNGTSTNGHAPDARAEWLETFDAFVWPRYPRRVGKPAARRAWLQIKPWSDDTAKAVASGISRWLEYWQDKGTATEHIPHPSTFFNQRRWEDQPS